MSLGAAGLLQTASIQQATQNVFQAFLSLKEFQSSVHVQIVDTEARFRIWAANIGAHQSQRDPRSADQKLRNATQIRTRITQILEELVETLEDLQSILSGDREAQTFDDADAADLDQSLTAPRTEDQEILLSLDDLTTSLLEVSAFVHSTQGRNRVAYAKAATKHSSFTSEFDTAHVAHKCPKLERQPKLLKKLGEAITQRRQFLTYARDHHDKIAADAVATSLDRVEAQAGEHTENLDPDVQEATTSYSRPTEALTKNTSIHSADVDEVQWARLGGVDNNDATSEVSSFMSSLPDEHEVEAAKIPELTTVCNEPGQPFECPLCYAILAFKNQHSWRKHVFSDLRAYVCTNTECDSGLFESREAWLQHEQDVHNRDWHCPQCQYRGTDREDILSHIRAGHANQWIDQFLLKPMIDAASAIKQGFEAINCPFCDAWGERFQASRNHPLPTPVIVPARRFLRHLAQHMEQLALFALPLLQGHQEAEGSAEGGRNGDHAIAVIDAEGAEDEDTESDSDDENRVPNQQLVDESPELRSTTIGRPQSRSSTSSKHSYRSKRNVREIEDGVPFDSNAVASTVHDETGRRIGGNTNEHGSSIASSTDDHPAIPMPLPPLRVKTPEANCAICGAPPFPECLHEGERLELALTQALERWPGFNAIRDWVLNRARNQIITTFNLLRQMRMEAHRSYLESLPYYTLYRRFNGQPPLQPAQIQLINAQVNQANTILQQGVDQDWRTSCLRYPEILDYYFNLAELNFPSDTDQRIQDPRFGSPQIPSRGTSKRSQGEHTYTYTYSPASPHTNRPDTSASIRDESLRQEEVSKVSSEGDRVVHVYSADRDEPAEQEPLRGSTNNDRVIHVYSDRAQATDLRHETEASWSEVESSTRYSRDEAIERPVNAANVKDQASPLPFVLPSGSGTNATECDTELEATRHPHEKYKEKNILAWAYGLHAGMEKAETMPPGNTNDHHTEASVAYDLSAGMEKYGTVPPANTNDHHTEASLGSKDVQLSVASRPISPGSEDSHFSQKAQNSGGRGANAEPLINPFAPLSTVPKATKSQLNGQSYASYQKPDSGYHSTFDPSSYSGNPFVPGPTNNAGSMAPPYGYTHTNYFGPGYPGYPQPNPFAQDPPYSYPSWPTGHYMLSKSASLARHGDRGKEDVSLLLRVTGAYKQARIEANHPKVSSSPVVNRKERVVEDVALLLNVGRAYRS